MLLAGDLRPSTPRIMVAVARAITDAGYTAVNCGRIPSPALALGGWSEGLPSVMVTGSHIPDDRNGIKFNKASGEVLKEDEAGIRAQTITLEDALFSPDGAFQVAETGLGPVNPGALDQYIQRYRDFFPGTPLAGLRLGVYQHSAVGRSLLADLLETMGAEVLRLGWSDAFVPVDTEAIRSEDCELATRWARELGLFCVVSLDGDSDRPLVSDSHGNWLRGDIAGILCARFLGAEVVCVPVSCNTAVERCGWFREVRRTRIGSPYVVAAMQAAERDGPRRVVGYEANGGFLIQSDITEQGRTLRALPTRDAFIVILSLLIAARSRQRTIEELVEDLPARFTASGLLRDCPPEASRRLLARFQSRAARMDVQPAEAALSALFGPVGSVDWTDGARVVFANGEIAHFRPSGNAPEFRCYCEAATPGRAVEMVETCLSWLRHVIAQESC